MLRGARTSTVSTPTTGPRDPGRARGGACLAGNRVPSGRRAGLARDGPPRPEQPLPVSVPSASPRPRRGLGRSAELGRNGLAGLGTSTRLTAAATSRPGTSLVGLADRSRRLQSLEPSSVGGDNRETPILWIRGDCCVQLVTGCQLPTGARRSGGVPVVERFRCRPPTLAGFGFQAGFATGSGIHDVDPNCGYNLNMHHLRVSWGEPTTLLGIRR